MITRVYRSIAEQFRTAAFAGAVAFALAVCGPTALQAQSESSEDFMSGWLDGLTLFGQVRLRPEYKSNFDFNRSTDDQSDYVGQRIQLGLEKVFNEDTRMRITLQDARVWGGTPGSDTGLNTANRETTESIDLREGWIEMNRLLGPLGFRAGRQVLSYGDQRLLGGSEWSNVGSSFDALRFHFDTDFYRAHLFGAVLSEEDSDATGNTTAVGSGQSSGFQFQCDATGANCRILASTARELNDGYLSGFYNTLRWSDHLHTDFYYFGLHKKFILNETPSLTLPGGTVATQDRARQRDNLNTYGLRFTNRTQDGKAPTIIDWTAEAVWQSGRTGREIDATWDPFRQRVVRADILGAPVTNASGAFETVAVYREKERYDTAAFALDAGVTFDQFRFGGKYQQGSGDPDRSDAAVATFQALFPTAHGFFGGADLAGWRNVLARAGNVSYDAGSWGRFQFAVWDIRKDALQDAWYDASGAARSGLSTESYANARFGQLVSATGVVSQPVARLGRQLIKEYDFVYSLKLRTARLSLGYSYVYAGDAARIVINNSFAPYDQQRRNFDPRADFAFIMLDYQF